MADTTYYQRQVRIIRILAVLLHCTPEVAATHYINTGMAARFAARHRHHS